MLVKLAKAINSINSILNILITSTSTSKSSMEIPTETCGVQQIKGRRRLVLFPLPYQGHISPMLQLANILYSKGFSVTIIHTRFNSPNPSIHPDFTFLSIPDGLLEHQASTKDIIALNTVLNVNCVEPFKDCLAKLLADEDANVACLITDVIWHFTQSVADSFEIPRLVLRTTSVWSFHLMVNLPLFRASGYLSIQGALNYHLRSLFFRPVYMHGYIH